MDLFEAAAARDLGMLRAAKHAEATHMGWNDRAYAFLEAYARQHKDFISEDVSDASKQVDFPQPPTDRAWGSVYRKAIKDGLIIQIGSGRSRRRHASICPRWGSLVYRVSS
jgi:hypothetical protein